MMKYSIAKSALGIIAVVMMGLLYLPDIEEAYAAESDTVIVSLGDSYSSGEGIPPFYGEEKRTKDKKEDPDWLAHRSTKSWPGRLRQPGQKKTVSELKLKDKQWFFLASSGAETKHIIENLDPYKYQEDEKNGYQVKTVRRLNEIRATVYTLSDKSKSIPLEPQLNIFKKKKLKADYVTITIGGNDLGFADIIATAADPRNQVRDGKNSELESLLEEKWKLVENGTIEKRLKKTYKNISDAAGDEAMIIVAGYPRLISSKGSWKGVLFTPEEAQAINEKVEAFDERLAKYVRDCKTDGMNIKYATVLDAFGDRGAYSKDGELIRAIQFIPRPGDINILDYKSPYSCHPNEEGAKVYAKCVQEEIDYLESKKDTTAKDVIGAWYWAGSGATSPIKLNKDGTLEVEEVIGEWEARGTWTCKGKTVIIVRDGVEEKLKYNKEKDILFYEQGGEGSCYKRYEEGTSSKGGISEYFKKVNVIGKTYSTINSQYGPLDYSSGGVSLGEFEEIVNFDTTQGFKVGFFYYDLYGSPEEEATENPDSICVSIKGTAESLLGISGNQTLSDQELAKELSADYISEGEPHPFNGEVNDNAIVGIKKDSERDIQIYRMDLERGTPITKDTFLTIDYATYLMGW